MFVSFMMYTFNLCMAYVLYIHLSNTHAPNKIFLINRCVCFQLSVEFLWIYIYIYW